MTEAEQFRQYAKEAMEWASRSADENEKLHLIELASTLAKAAVASQRLISLPRDADEAKLPTRF